MSGDGLFLATGGLAFAASFKESGGFPENGYAIIGATVVLTFLAATTKGSVLQGPVKALAALTLLGAVYQFVPAFTSDTKKGKKNG